MTAHLPHYAAGLVLSELAVLRLRQPREEITTLDACHEWANNGINKQRSFHHTAISSITSRMYRVGAMLRPAVLAERSSTSQSG